MLICFLRIKSWDSLGQHKPSDVIFKVVRFLIAYFFRSRFMSLNCSLAWIKSQCWTNILCPQSLLQSQIFLVPLKGSKTTTKTLSHLVRPNLGAWGLRDLRNCAESHYDLENSFFLASADVMKLDGVKIVYRCQNRSSNACLHPGPMT